MITDTQSHYVGQSDSMTGKQVLQVPTPPWAMPLLEEGMRYRGSHGGRGSGKSHFFAELLILRAVTQPIRAVCLREIQKSLNQSVKKLLEIKIDSLNLGKLFIIQNDKILGKNGSEILFQGMQNHTSDSIKSLESIDIAWMEEAQNISARSLELLRPTIRKPGSEIWASWNPKTENDPIEFLRHNPPPKTVVVEVNYMDNPWFSSTTLVDEMEYYKKENFDKYQHIWLGHYQSNSEARVFNNWKVEEFEAPSDATHRLGADWGYAIDPTVLIRCHIDGRKLYIDYEAFQLNCEIFNIPILFNQIPESELFPIVADSSRPETISYLRQHGYPRIYPSVKGRGSIEDGVEWLKSFDIIIHPRCTHVIDEMNTYSYKADEVTGKITGKLKDAKNHTIDAIRYACEAVRRIEQKKPVYTQPQPQRNYWK